MRYDSLDQEDDDYSDEEFGEDDATAECPHCQREIYDDAVQCPHCGNYISTEDQRVARRPLWIIITTVVLLCVLLYEAVGPLIGLL